MKRADIIGFLDGDLGNTASEVEKLIIPIINNECDVTIAKFPPAKKKGGLGFVKNLAKNSVYEMTGVELTSTLSGQRIFKKEVLEIFDDNRHIKTQFQNKRDISKYDSLRDRKRLKRIYPQR